MVLPQKTTLTQKYFDKRWQSIYTRLKVEEFFRESDVNFYAMQDLFNIVIYQQHKKGFYKKGLCYVCLEKCSHASKFWISEKNVEVWISLHELCAEHWLHALWGWCATHAHKVNTESDLPELCYESVSKLST